MIAEGSVPATTPGEWTIEAAPKERDYVRRYVVARECEYSAVRGHRVAIVIGSSDYEAEANVALIRAAKDLFLSLESCRWALIAMRDRLCAPANEAQSAAMNDLNRRIDLATAVIRNASPLTAGVMDRLKIPGDVDRISQGRYR
jgi:hypothetical protein